MLEILQESSRRLIWLSLALNGVHNITMSRFKPLPTPGIPLRNAHVGHQTASHEAAYATGKGVPP